MSWLLFDPLGHKIGSAQPLQKDDILIYAGPCLTVPEGTNKAQKQVTHVPGIRTLATLATSPVPIAPGRFPMTS